jgi:RNA polymerase sigma-70 factor (ECF subfamily)
MSETPQSLLERLRRDGGDSESWNDFVALYTPFLNRWLRNLSDLNGQDVEDLIQNVLTVVVRKLPEFEHNQRPGAFRRWLRNVLGNCLQEHRRRRPPPPVGGDAAPAWLGDLADDNSDLSRRFAEEHQEHVARKLLERGRGRFTPHQWTLFERVVLHGEKPAEVAAALGVSVNAVYLATSRILAWLRQEGQGLLDD